MSGILPYLLGIALAAQQQEIFPPSGIDLKVVYDEVEDKTKVSCNLAKLPTTKMNYWTVDLKLEFVGDGKNPASFRDLKLLTTGERIDGRTFTSNQVKVLADDTRFSLDGTPHLMSPRAFLFLNPSKDQVRTIAKSQKTVLRIDGDDYTLLDEQKEFLDLAIDIYENPGMEDVSERVAAIRAKLADRHDRAEAAQRMADAQYAQDFFRGTQREVGRVDEKMAAAVREYDDGAREIERAASRLSKNDARTHRKRKYKALIESVAEKHDVTIDALRNAWRKTRQ